MNSLAEETGEFGAFLACVARIYSGEVPGQTPHRSYDHAIDEFVAWCCSEPRLTFKCTVVLRYRFHLEQQAYALATINLRLAAVRRVAHEAADEGRSARS